ncbi:hypothetical protein KIPB_005279 [Kipferlia bialata]|uniref:Uncharacterized protein n=1 Tax=Kipferlia bialata TaxID=797122 RepID=A0A9K3CVC3_9EUKA|nr:hypothetical protein KIPB_005279 [Kipferlia bialata]|eukprot:g5279.t1
MRSKRHVTTDQVKQAIEDFDHGYVIKALLSDPGLTSSLPQAAITLVCNQLKSSPDNPELMYCACLLMQYPGACAAFVGTGIVGEVLDMCVVGGKSHTEWEWHTPHPSYITLPQLSLVFFLAMQSPAVKKDIGGRVCDMLRTISDPLCPRQVMAGLALVLTGMLTAKGAQDVRRRLVRGGGVHTFVDCLRDAILATQDYHTLVSLTQFLMRLTPSHGVALDTSLVAKILPAGSLPSFQTLTGERFPAQTPDYIRDLCRCVRASDDGTPLSIFSLSSVEFVLAGEDPLYVEGGLLYASAHDLVVVVTPTKKGSPPQTIRLPFGCLKTFTVSFRQSKLKCTMDPSTIAVARTFPHQLAGLNLELADADEVKVFTERVGADISRSKKQARLAASESATKVGQAETGRDEVERSNFASQREGGTLRKSSIAILRPTQSVERAAYVTPSVVKPSAPVQAPASGGALMAVTSASQEASEEGSVSEYDEGPKQDKGKGGEDKGDEEMQTQDLTQELPKPKPVETKRPARRRSTRGKAKAVEVPTQPDGEEVEEVEEVPPVPVKKGRAKRVTSKTRVSAKVAAECAVAPTFEPVDPTPKKAAPKSRGRPQGRKATQSARKAVEATEEQEEEAEREVTRAATTRPRRSTRGRGKTRASELSPTVPQPAPEAQVEEAEEEVTAVLESAAPQAKRRQSARVARRVRAPVEEDQEVDNPDVPSPERPTPKRPAPKKRAARRTPAVKAKARRGSAGKAGLGALTSMEDMRETGFPSPIPVAERECPSPLATSISLSAHPVDRGVEADSAATTHHTTTHHDEDDEEETSPEPLPRGVKGDEVHAALSRLTEALHRRQSQQKNKKLRHLLSKARAIQKRLVDKHRRERVVLNETVESRRRDLQKVLAADAERVERVRAQFSAELARAQTRLSETKREIAEFGKKAEGERVALNGHHKLDAQRGVADIQALAAQYKRSLRQTRDVRDDTLSKIQALLLEAGGSSQ